MSTDINEMIYSFFQTQLSDLISMTKPTLFPIIFVRRPKKIKSLMCGQLHRSILHFISVQQVRLKMKMSGSEEKAANQYIYGLNKFFSFFCSFFVIAALVWYSHVSWAFKVSFFFIFFSVFFFFIETLSFELEEYRERNS